MRHARDVPAQPDAFCSAARGARYEQPEHGVDLAEVNGRVFVNNASLGIYAAIVQSPQYREAKLKTAADLLPGLLGPDATPLDLRFTGPDGAMHRTAHLILVSNNHYQLARSPAALAVHVASSSTIGELAAIAVGRRD